MNSPEHQDEKFAWTSRETDPAFPEWTGWTGSVLLSDEIARYCEAEPRLITPFDAKLLKPARYQLTLGPEARVGGKDQVIDADHPLIIPPHQVAIVRTYETLNLPRFVIARWNLTVGMVYKGLLWVGALQVDPGWVGYLPAPLYNLSDQPVRIGFREKLFTIDFVRTTPFGGGCIAYPYPDQAWEKPINPPLRHYDPNNLHSGPYQALQDLSSLTEFRNFIGGFIPVILTVLAVMIAALGVLVARPAGEFIRDGNNVIGFWPTTAIGVSVASLALSLFSVAFALKSRRR